eukprot:1578032-Lingulodinium_polyedra.AAC.1
MPQGLVPGVRSCVVDWRAGRRLQLIPSPQVRDHLPLRVELGYWLEPDPAAARREAWDCEKLAQALQSGRGRREFLEELEKS